MMSKGWNTVCAVLIAAAVQAAPPAFKAGNKAMGEGRHDEAVNRYQEAAAASPESGEIYFNLGNALYRTGRFQEAAASYEYAASLTDSAFTRGRSWYNIGNCLMMEGQALRTEDPHSAAAVCRQAVWFYRMALNQDPNFEDAAYNLEVSQHIAAGIEEEILQQQEQEQEKNVLVKYIREKLQEFIERQTKLLQAQNTGGPQQALEAETRELIEVMETSGLHTDILLPDETALPGPLKETWEHTANAADAMGVPKQQTALDELLAALGAAPEDPNGQDGESDEDSEDFDDYDMDYEASDEEADMYEEADPFGDFSEYEEIRGVPPPNQTEMDILAEEVRNQERRKQKKAGEYKAVEKDW